MGRWIIGIGLVAVISIGVLVFRDFLPSNAGQLKAGDCLDVPAGDEVGDVQHHPCNEPHDGEVIFVGDFTGSETYPIQDAFDAWVKTECVDKAFPTYIGASFDAREDIDLGYFYPKSEQWSKDKQMICYVTPLPAGKVSVSYAKAAAPSGS